MLKLIYGTGTTDSKYIKIPEQGAILAPFIIDTAQDIISVSARVATPVSVTSTSTHAEEVVFSLNRNTVFNAPFTTSLQQYF